MKPHSCVVPLGLCRRLYFVPSDKSLGYFLSSLRAFFLHTNLKSIFTSSITTIHTEPWGPRKHKTGR